MQYRYFNTFSLFGVLAAVIVGAFLFFSSGVEGAAAAPARWRAEKVSQSYQEVAMYPERAITFVVEFLNTGTETWRNDTSRRGFVSLHVREKSMFEHPFWRDSEHPCVIKQEKVEPGETATCTFAFRAPSALGKYMLSVELAAEDVTWIEGGKVDIPVVVTLDPDAEKKRRQQERERKENMARMQEKRAEEKEEKIAAVETIPEPLDFRVGLFYRDDPLKITNWGLFHLTDPNGNILQTYGAGTIVTVQYQRSRGVYRVQTPGKTTDYPHYVRFVSAIGSKTPIFELVNVENRPAWNRALNENRFRGIIEYRFNPRTGNIWTINELPLEEYMQGIGEIGERAPMDALKASAIAARGYALSLYRNNRKYYGFIHAVNTQADQLFGGYVQEINRPNFQRAVKETRGMVVTYKGKPVVTPYFSQSNGETRGFDKVWGGQVKPWLVSVSVPCDVGERRIGHGVGMSQQASICMAKQGMSYEQILKHFYSGTEVRRVYE